MKITRDVVVDLWPLYASGEASADTRALVEAFLRDDPEFDRTMREQPTIGGAPPPLARDAEVASFLATRKKIHKRDMLLFLAMLFTCMAFGRIVSDTSWDVSPRNFAITAAIAGVFWIAFFLRLVRSRAALR